MKYPSKAQANAAENFARGIVRADLKSSGAGIHHDSKKCDVDSTFYNFSDSNVT